MADVKQDKAAKAEMAPSERTKRWIESRKKGSVADVLGTTPGYRYYVVDPNGRKPGPLTALRSRLYEKGYELCSKVGDTAYSPTVPGGEVWRISEADYKALFADRKDRDDAARRAAEAPTEA